MYHAIDIPYFSKVDVRCFPDAVDSNNYPCKRGKLLHHTGQVVTSYGARCYIIRGTLLHTTGHVATINNTWIATQVSLVHVTVITLIELAKMPVPKTG